MALKRPYSTTNNQTAAPPLPPGPPPPAPPPTGQPQQQQQQQQQQQYYSYQAYANPPPLPPGPPLHPQYPGYGYGTPQVPAVPVSPYTNYSTPQAYAAQPAPITYGVNPPPPPPPPSTGYGHVPQPQGGNLYAAYGPPAYPQQQPSAPNPPQQQQQPQYGSYPPPGPPNPYAIAPPPPPPSLYQGQGPPAVQHQQYPGAQGYDTSSNAGGGAPSPQGPPPLKRTRYDSMGAPQPMMGIQQQQQQPMGAPGGGYGMLPALPGINPNSGYAGRGGGAGGGRGRGGYAEGGMRAPSAPSTTYGGASPMGGSSRGGGGGGSYRGGRGDGPSMSSSSRAPDSRSVSGRPESNSYPLPSRGGAPSNAPFGSSTSTSRNSPAGSERGGPSSRGGRGGYPDRGRPVSSLPRGGGRGGYAGASSSVVSGGGAGVPKGPRAAKGAGMTFGQRGEVNTRELKKERKWGALGGDRSGRDGAREETKRTLTDFRIASLEIPQLEWEWKAEVIKAIVEVAEKEAQVESLPKKEGEEVDEADDDDDKLDIVDEATAAVTPLPPLVEAESGEALPPPSSPSRYDMSIDSIAPADLVSEESKPAPIPALEDVDTVPTDSETTSTVRELEPQPAPLKKKLSKKQKKAEAAAKRAATIAAATAVSAKEFTLVEEAKKDGKHGRDEEEGDGLVITDVTAAKKVKPDHGEVVVLEAVELEKSGGPTSASSTVLPIATPARQAHPLPPRPVTATAKPSPAPLPKSVAILEGIPTGPKTTSRTFQASPSIAPPPNRENSRLRIYFSSPVASSSTLAAHQLRESKEPRRESIEPSAAKSQAGTPALEDPKEVLMEELVKEEVKDEEDVDGVDVDGVDVDGEPIDDSGTQETSTVDQEEEDAVSKPELRDEDNDSDDTDADQVQSALTRTVEVDSEPPTAVDPERPTAPEEDEPKPDVATTTDGTSSYPPDPYSLGSPSKSTIPSPLDAATQSLAEVPEEVVPITSSEPSADRISISYARNTRRMVLDAGIVKAVKIFRADARIELTVSIEPPTFGEGEAVVMDELRVCRGLLVEVLDVEIDDYVPINRAALERAWQSSAEEESTDSELSALDPLLPPLHRLLANTALIQGDGLAIDSSSNNQDEITIIARLDSSNPLTEARWVKTGDVEGWITSLSLESKKKVVSEWKGKITVSDPDPPPTIQHALDGWATSCSIGSLEDRNKFVEGHLSNIDNVFEILLRLTRGDRAAPHSSSASMAVSTLAATLSAPYAEHQTQVSLAVLAMFRLSVETAAKAGIPKDEVEKQVAEIVRGIPYHLIFKSLDSMFREFRARSKKSSGAKH